MATKNKYQRQKQQYSNDGGQTWFDVVPANYRKGSLIEEASEDCNTTQWVEVQNAWYCIEDSVDIQYRWVDIEQTMCNGYDKYSMQKQQQSTDGGVTWTDTGNTRQGTLIESNSADCGYKILYQWVIVQNEYICNGYDKYVKEKQQKSTDGGVTWTDTGNTRQGDVIELNSEDCGYVVNKRWVTVEGEYICNGYDKYVKEKEQQSTDGGVTWTDTDNTRQGTLIESNSADCGYKTGYEMQYLTMEALDDATINVYPQNDKNNLYYKIDNQGWKKFNMSSDTINLDTITLKTSSKIMFKETLTSSRLKATRFKCSIGHINVYGNVMSLVYGDDFIGKTTMSNFSLKQVFSASNIIDAGNLILPATTLAEWCYEGMFSGCTSLTQAPQLPATTLKGYCYVYMFNGCTSLTQAPQLPATTLAKSCYEEMFSGCTSLTQAPQLPATTLAEWCYDDMFNGCTSLTQAPQLPATTLAKGCYSGMFRGCTSLTQAPELPATTLAEYCYQEMFRDCTSLTQAPKLPATTLADRCYVYMFNGCTSLNNINCQLTDVNYNATHGWVTDVQTNGKFTYNCVNENWTRGVNGIPIYWTRQCE